MMERNLLGVNVFRNVQIIDKEWRVFVYVKRIYMKKTVIA